MVSKLKQYVYLPGLILGLALIVLSFFTLSWLIVWGFIIVVTSIIHRRHYDLNERRRYWRALYTEYERALYTEYEHSRIENQIEDVDWRRDGF